ncbi:NACHT domain-containing protein [Actinoplanes sp. M2I2]|uniref:NACHT domain-containing protein n=1 Tax=Actinoplanes sp. M2I2 TaxID=1734444 RepID=UPI002022607B|nr:NACHT domain-containing protein [Actinoplanes sp. M2I2]
MPPRRQRTGISRTGWSYLLLGSAVFSSALGAFLLFLIREGREKSDQWASILGLFIGISGLVVSIVGLIVSSRSSSSEYADPSAGRWAEPLSDGIRELVRHQVTHLSQPVDVEVVVHESLPRGRLETRQPGYTTTTSALHKVFLTTLSGSLLITGETGTGKSHLLQRLAYRTAEAARSAGPDAPATRLPVYARFRDWEADMTVEDWLIRALDDLVGLSKDISAGGMSKDIAAGMIEASRVVLLLDGLDELDSAQLRQSRLEEIERLQERVGPITIAITCRTTEYERLPATQQWRHVELSALSKASVLGVLAANRLTALRSSAQGNADLLEALTNLFILNAAAAVYRESPVEDTVHGGSWRQRILDRYVDHLTLAKDSSTFMGRPAAAATRLREGLSWIAVELLTGERQRFTSHPPPRWYGRQKSPEIGVQALIAVGDAAVVGGVVAGALATLLKPAGAAAIGGLIAASVLAIDLYVSFRMPYGFIDGDDDTEQTWSVQHAARHFPALLWRWVRKLLVVIALAMVCGLISVAAVWRSPFSIDWEPVLLSVMGMLLLAVPFTFVYAGLHDGPASAVLPSPVETGLKPVLRQMMRPPPRTMLLSAGLSGLAAATIAASGFLFDRARAVAVMPDHPAAGMSRIFLRLESGWSEAPLGSLYPGVWWVPTVALIVAVTVCLANGVLTAFNQILTVFWGRWLQRAAGLPCDPMQFLFEATRYGLVEERFGTYTFTHRLLKEHFAEYETRHEPVLDRSG